MKKKMSERLFNFEHRFPADAMKAIDKEDLAGIWSRFTKTKEDSEYRKALNLLSFMDPDKLRTNLHKAISNQKISVNRRILSISALNEIGTSKSEKYYLSALEFKGVTSGESLKLLQGLSRFGTSASLPAIREVKGKKGMQQMAVFTELMVSARAGLPHKLKWDLTKTEVGSSQKATLRKVAESKETIEIDDDFGMKLAPKGQQFKCGRSALTMLMDQKFTMGRGDVPQLAGIIGSGSEDGKNTLTKMVVVLDQSVKGVRKILVFRRDGLLAYGGDLNSKGDFELHCTKKFGSDLALLKGSYHNDRLLISHFEVADRRFNTLVSAPAK